MTTYQNSKSYYVKFLHIQDLKEMKKYIKAIKQVINLPRMTRKRLLYSEQYLTIRRTKQSKWQREQENSTNKLHCIKIRIDKWEIAHNSLRQCEIQLSKLHIGHNSLTHEHLMSRKKPETNMHKCDIWKPQTNNQRLSTGGTIEKKF